MVHQRPHVYPIYASCASMYSHIRGRQKTVKLVRFPRRARAAASVTKPGLGAAGRGAAGDAESGRGAARTRPTRTHALRDGRSDAEAAVQSGGRPCHARARVFGNNKTSRPTRSISLHYRPAARQAAGVRSSAGCSAQRRDRRERCAADGRGAARTTPL